MSEDDIVTTETILGWKLGPGPRSYLEGRDLTPQQAARVILLLRDHHRPSVSEHSVEVERCMVSGCDQPAVELHANDAPLMSPEYAERWVCRWHRSNPFPSPHRPDLGANEGEADE